MADLEKLARELDDIDRKLREQRARLIVVWRSIEHSRRGVVVLDAMTYSARKVEMAELQSSISSLESKLLYSWWYEGEHWPTSQESPAKVPLKQLWQLWRNVVAARKAVADLPDKPVYEHKAMTDLWFAEYCACCLADTVTERQRIDARIARDRAEWIYDCALRVFEGRERWSWDKHSDDGPRIRAPKRPLPTGNNKPRTFVRSSFIGA